MRHLVILMLLTVGCTSEKSPNTVNVVGLKSELADTKDQLNICKAQLEVYRQQSPRNSDGPISPEPEKSCNTVDFTSVYKDGRLLATCETVSINECGVIATECSDDAEYGCLTDVKLKSESKEICN